MLELKNIVKYCGDEKILSGISFSVSEKGIYGILGAVGEQRRMLARIICGCENADEGTVSVDGELMSAKSPSLKKRVRLVPAVLDTDGSCTVAEYLGFVGEILGVEPEKRYRQIKEAMELVGIDDVQNRLVSAVGNEKRYLMSVAAALIGNPEIIVFEAPARLLGGDTGESMRALLEMLAEIKTVVLLSQNPSEVKLLCSRVAVIGGGRIAIEGDISEIEAKINATNELYISVRGEAEAVLSAINGVDKVVGAKIVSTEKNGVHSIRVEHYPDAQMKDKLFAALSEINAPMLSVRAVTLTLDDVYYSLTSAETEGADPENDGQKDNKKTRKGRKSR